MESSEYKDYDTMWGDELYDQGKRSEVIRKYEKSRSGIGSNDARPEDGTLPEQEEEQQAKDTTHIMCSCGYILFLIPLLLDRHNPTYIFHSRQGLKVNILEILVLVLRPILLTIGAALNSVLIISITSIVCYILWAIIGILICYGIFNSWTDHAKDIPLPF